MATFVKLPPPRQLTQSETLDSLDHWKSIFRNYFRRDSVFKQFLESSCKWDPSVPDTYNLEAKDGMSPEERKDALIDFLSNLAGFLPHSYLTSKLRDNTKCLGDCWNIIEEHYNIKVSSETLLDFESIKKDPAENYRQLYERLLQHCKLHLAPAKATVDTLTNTSDDKMSISIMNLVALQWLRKINPQLIQIVKTEYATELRSTTQLAALVPRIAPNIDALLSRYNSSAVAKVIVDDQHHADEDGGHDDAGHVRRVGQRGRGLNAGRVFRGGRAGNPPRKPNSQLFCAGCFSLGKQLNMFIDFKHKPEDCTRQRAVSRILQAEAENDLENSEIVDGDDFYEDDGKTNSLRDNPTNSYSFQNESQAISGPASQHKAAAVLPSNLVLTINVNQNPGETHSSQTLARANFIDPYKAESHFSDEIEFIKKIENVASRQHLWSSTSVRKESSPMIYAELNSQPCTPTIDEGSEINCIDTVFAARNNLKTGPTGCSAKAAGNTAMVVSGQTLESVVLKIPHKSSSITWDLSKCVVIEDLGVDILIGEPGKIDNKIVTKSYLKKIETLDDCGEVIDIPYYHRKEENRYLCKAVRTETLMPGEYISVKLPPFLENERSVVAAPTRENPSNFITPKVLNVVENGSVKLVNDCQTPVLVRKNMCIADITALKDVSQNCGKVCIQSSDKTHLKKPKIFLKSEANKSYTDQVVIDPDNQMPEEFRNSFRTTCEEFRDVINPNPGRYNNSYGDIDCSIDFCSTPPPSVRARLPNYSNEKLKLMAEQMDKMEAMGVLAKPEDAGVVPAFVVPSLLVPKPEKGEWRLVSDFTPLNIHIKKFETISPGIEEAKRTLARFKYNIEMDLSNYFWQGGMRKEDMQYLATPHPFKGLRVYTVEPQGLRNASEHAYERLTRIFGDLRQEDKMTCMADGLYIVADTFGKLLETFKEVLQRARDAGLTFKPKKIVIAPRDTVLFGWRKMDDGWRPIDHTISPLVNAEEPTTVKQLRSFIGSYKQLAECIDNYAVLLGPLEKAVAGSQSAERIQWSDELSDSFRIAKEALNNVETIHVPKPSDKLEVFTDYSAENKAIGGKLMIKRFEDDGTTRKLLGGHFSCKLNTHQKNWLPCEGEALGVRMIAKHYSAYIRENKNLTTIFTDNLPTVNAWKRMKTGAFSASARVASFLTGLSALTVEVVHKPGKEMVTSDYNSRHPNSCSSERCKICKFAFEMEKIGDSAVYRVKSISANDVENGIVRMPHCQRAAWKKVQSQDRVHELLLDLISNSKTPEKKRTKGDFTRVKRLHNLYRTGQLKIANDGLVTVKHTDAAGNDYDAISVPHTFFPGLVHALHIKLNHPSKAQTQRLINRYFYSAGHARIIEEVISSCTTCAALKTLPKEIFSQSTSENSIFGANFSADVIKKDGQLIFLCREKLSQFTFTRLIPNETADSLRDSIVMAVLELMPDVGTTVQVDCAPGLQTLAAESKLDGTILKKLGILVDLGRTLNVNKNPVAENAIKEFHKERLKLNAAGGRISEIERSIITKNMNSRIRERGLTSKEMALNRDQCSNKVKPSDDNALASEQFKKRIDRHPEIEEVSLKCRIGDNVFLKSDKSKLRGRELYKVVRLFQKNGEKWAVILKCDQKFMSKEYEVKLSEIFLAIPNRHHGDLNNDFKSDDDEEDIDKEPGCTGSSKDTINDNDLDPINRESEKVDVIDKGPKDVGDKSENIISKEEPDEVDTPMERKPKRRSALKQRLKMKQLLSCLRTRTESKPKPLSHGWFYDDWIRDIENEDDYDIVEHSLVTPTDTPSNFSEDGFTEDEEEPQLCLITSNTNSRTLQDNLETLNKPLHPKLKILEDQLRERGIDFETCAPDVLNMVHDFIDYHTIGAKILISVIKIQSWWRKIISQKTSDTHSQEGSHSDSLKHYSDEDANHNDVFEIGEVLGTFNQEKESRTTSVSVNVFANEHSRSNSLEHFVPILESRHASLDESELIRVKNPLDVSEIDGNNVSVALNKVRESRTISVGVNVFGNEHSRSNSLELFVPIQESRHASLDESELTRRAVAGTTMTRVPLETTPLKNRENIDTDSDNEEEERYQTDPVEAQRNEDKFEERAKRLDYAEFNTTGRKLMMKRTKKK